AACDGTIGDRCVFPVAGSLCEAARCTEDGFRPARDCDGSGTCLAAAPQVSCSPYACDSKGCLDSCQEKSDCAEGSYCKGGACTASCVERQCNESGYQCNSETNECPNTCNKSETDCAGGYYCHPLEHQCVKAVAFPAGSLPACSTAGAPLRSRPWLVALTSLLCAAAARRKRRASRPVA
ncbi:MAG TPA: hypothetical protein VJV79_02745, partial [Polyangiaceae bacterium]|nr:hypothetical protein [Polyangiaceae bacterium]